MLSPPLSPPHMNRGPQRSVAKTSSLKLITSFNNGQAKAKFFAGGDEATPLAAMPTPIVASAGGYGNEDPATALLRPSQRSAMNTPASAIPRGGFSRHRLPSIGEAPDKSRPLELLSEDPSEDDDADSQFSLHMPPINRTQSASPQMMKKGVPHQDRLRGNRDPPPPSPSPQSLAALMSHGTQRNGSRSRMPDGLDLQLPSYDQVPGDMTSPEPSAASSARYHWPSRRRGPGSVASSVTSAASSVARSHHRGRDRGHHQSHTSTKTLDDYLNNLGAMTGHQVRQASRGRDHESSRVRKPVSRDVSESRGRASSRGTYTPKGPKRSPTSPVPMSPEDLITLATPKDAPEDFGLGQGPSKLIDIEERDAPSTVKKASKYNQRESSKSRTREHSQARSTGRARSTSRRPPALDLRGRSNIREGSVRHSPTSPVPMSASAADFYGSESDDDLKKAVEAKEQFRARRLTGRSRSRDVNGPASPTSVRSRGQSFASMDPQSPAISRHRGSSFSQNNAPMSPRGGRDFLEFKETKTRDRSQSRKRTDMPMPTPQPMSLKSGGMNFGPDSARKSERQLKKEAAARELEDRRRSLASRAAGQAPPIVHPDELSPAQFGSFVPPKDLPLRSATASPGTSARGMHSTRGTGPHIGLPATPKAMRLVLDSDHKNVPVPPIPASFAQAASPSPRSTHASPARVTPPPKKPSPELPTLAPLTLLPSTVYTPPPPRSASAPPVEPHVPNILRSGSAMNQRGLPGGMSRKNSMSSEAGGGRRPSYGDNSNKIPPPPPPAPTHMLKELQHLAMPPPPPPAPIPYGNKNVVYGSSGMIEIVMDDDQPLSPPPVPVAASLSDQHVPIIAPPAPPSSRNGHHRGRSSIDNSIAGRISRATERMRSASRSRAAPGLAGRINSPDTGSAPYESVPPPPPPPLSFQARAAMSPPMHIQGEYKTGLHESEMI